MQTVADIVVWVQAGIAAETARAQMHVDVGDTTGAVHHLSRKQVLEELLKFIKG